MSGDVDDGFVEGAGSVVAACEGVEVAGGVVGASWEDAGIFLLIEVVAGIGVGAPRWEEAEFIGRLANSVPLGCLAECVCVHHGLDAVENTHDVARGHVGFAIKEGRAVPWDFWNHPDELLTGPVVEVCFRLIVASRRIDAPSCAYWGAGSIVIRGGWIEVG